MKKGKYSLSKEAIESIDNLNVVSELFSNKEDFIVDRKKFSCGFTRKRNYIRAVFKLYKEIRITGN